MYEAKNFDSLLGTPGFSDTLLKNHFTLYQGYVTNTNKLNDEIKSLTIDGKIGTPTYNELKRRYGWEFNGMRLHELYFDNLINGGTILETTSTLASKIFSQFGSVENWEKDFRAVGAMRGIGWTILYLDKETDTLTNVWINEHDTGHLAGCTPLLVMDVFEHAFMIDYGLKRADYIEAFFKNINWDKISSRLA